MVAGAREWLGARGHGCNSASGPWHAKEPRYADLPCGQGNISRGRVGGPRGSCRVKKGGPAWSGTAHDPVGVVVRVPRVGSQGRVRVGQV